MKAVPLNLDEAGHDIDKRKTVRLFFVIWILLVLLPAGLLIFSFPAISNFMWQKYFSVHVGIMFLSLFAAGVCLLARVMKLHEHE